MKYAMSYYGMGKDGGSGRCRKCHNFGYEHRATGLATLPGLELHDDAGMGYRWAHIRIIILIILTRYLHTKCYLLQDARSGASAREAPILAGMKQTRARLNQLRNQISTASQQNLDTARDALKRAQAEHQATKERLHRAYEIEQAFSALRTFHNKLQELYPDLNMSTTFATVLDQVSPCICICMHRR